MIGALWILVVTVVAGVLLFLGDRFINKGKRAEEKVIDNAAGAEAGGEVPANENEPGADAPETEECCGMHLVCEKDTLSPFTDEVVYYDDEELDRFAGREPSSYTAEEEEEFRDVLMTLLPSDIPGWARSITVRGIELPYDLRDELLILINEQRGR